MTTKKLTLVTGLFNIGRGEMEGGMNRKFDHYLECFEKLLQVDYPMVIYIEPEHEHIVWKHRSRDNTRVLSKSLADLRNFPFYDKVQKIRTNPDWYNRVGWLTDSTQAKLELYNPLVMSKVFFLNDASLMNHFGTKYYAWIDAGIANTLGNPSAYLDEQFESLLIPHIKNKVNFIAFPYDGQVEVHGFTKPAMNRYAGEDTTYVCRGGFFAGPADEIHKMNSDYYHLLHQTLEEGEMGTEESIFTLLSYREPKNYKLHMIEGNGLVYKFFQDLKDNKITKECEYPLAIYALTFNQPKQFRMWAESYKKAYPEDFEKHKKYVVNNSTDDSVAEEYSQLFTEFGFDVIHQGQNLGINDGRAFCAKHFHANDHKYYIFFEDDMLFVYQGDNPADYGQYSSGIINSNEPCKNGFIRYIPNLLQKSMDIMDDNELDFLRLTHTEFYGDCHQNWGFKNVASHRRDEIFPNDKDTEEMRWKTKIDYTGTYKGISYAVGNFHYSNWPLMFNKQGNYQLFLSDPYDAWFEQTLSSLSCQYVHDGKMKVGCLFASPINHLRKYHYPAQQRKENRH